jgi:hydroxymethylglutaryl-CoA lyase
VNVMPDITIFEVGPRDGLQNESEYIPTDTKIALIDKLSATGLQKIEVTSFVSPKWVPQMADNADVMKGITKKKGVIYAALTPNLKGLEAAINAGASEVAIFTAASESFNQKNINCTISESIKRFEPLMERAKAEKIKIRGYISCVTHCPYEGVMNPDNVASIAEKLLQMGCYEISLGDTIGKAEPQDIKNLLNVMTKTVSIHNLALHCHDTHGRALTNIKAGLDLGIRTIDSAVGGLGGCPYAPGASGNVATEDVLVMLNELGFDSGVDLKAIKDTAKFISDYLNKPINSEISSP